MSETVAGAHAGAMGQGPHGAYPDDRSIAALFADAVTRAPDAVAVVDGRRSVSYGELDRWSDRLAARLVDFGVRAGEPVGVLGERSLEAPAAILAVLKAGAVYVPLDRSDPVGRLRALADELSIRRMVWLPGAVGLLDRIPGLEVAAFRDGADVAWSPVHRGGGDVAYVMFTSGSTGPPKAVAVPHRAVARLVINTNYIELGRQDRVANTGHLAFDASVFEIWGALLNGARVVVVDAESLVDPARLQAVFDSARVTVAWLSAGVFHHCARSRPAMFRGLRCLISGGDVLNPELVRRVLAAGPPESLLNAYGPTENTTFSTTYRIEAVPPGLAGIPIGRPVANSTCRIVTAEGEPAPVGEPGELWVGGDGVAVGYLNSPDLTARRFVADPAGRRPDARLFRTGDLARWLPDGTIEFIGRLDRMVKFRDFRVDLDEIQGVLSRCPGVGEAAVVPVGDGARVRSIAAFYVLDADAGDAATAARVREFLADWLPQFMVPATLVAVERLPLTGTGKVDGAALAATLARVALQQDSSAQPRGRTPQTALQVGLARLWSEALDVDDIGLDDDFFALGGNSLTAARVFTRLQTTFGIDAAQSRFLTARLLADPSLEACAAAVAEARSGTLGRAPEGPAIDFRREATLDVPIPVTGPARAAGEAGQDILLTGASGFVGSYLLRELLRLTDARIHCLVRALDPGQAAHRIQAAQTRYGLGEVPPARVVPVVGDLAQPLLGLPPEDFEHYAGTLGLIIHSAAYVNFTYPYADLAKVTVHGVKELIRLAGHRRGIPVHAVSSLAVLAGFGAAGVPAVTEDTPLDFPEHLYMGYTETKWVAEELLRGAAAAGLPVSIYRPYEVSGDLTDGAWNLENATCALLRLIVDVGVAPDIDLPLDLVPVDVLAAQIVHIALTRTADTRTYHLTNPRPARLADMVERLREHGYPIRTAAYPDWVRRAVRHACDHPEHPFTPFVPLWVDRSPLSGLVVKQMYLTSRFPRFGSEHADRALADLDRRMPPVDADLLDRYIRFFQRVAFFPPPPGQTTAAAVPAVPAPRPRPLR
ncbi:amino acid adenylation domain-containing protein [Dactylosporangium sp. NPDC049525]|uniref:amino acid adenylation domain-containing protein n=1 Tax=Dactylosporangium sp. NPDC049525 TaxID=3154730 RepID=UPI003437F815